MKNLQLAQRARIGVVLPATNTGVEYDLQKLPINNVTWHSSRFNVSIPSWGNDPQSVNDFFENFLEGVRIELPTCINNAMAADIHHLLLGMSAETFWGGKSGNESFEKRVLEDMRNSTQVASSDIKNVGLTTGATAIVSALRTVGAKKISVIDPYPPIGGEQVALFFKEMGFEIHKLKGIPCETAWDIARIEISDVLKAVNEVDAESVDAIVQVGTNLSTADIFPTLEKVLGKPCLNINTASAWHAVRACGIQDQFTGSGILFEQY